MEITVNQPKLYLTANATTTISNNSNGQDIIEIAVPLDGELIDLGYPRLSGTYKVVNGTWSATFSIDFLLLEQSDGGYVFEAETVSINRNQFLTKDAMIGRLEQLYATYYDKVLNCIFDADRDVINQVKEDFGGTVSMLKIVDTDMVIHLGEH